MPLLRALRHRRFALLLAARAVSALGDFVHDVALAWLVLELTGSAAAMGLVVAAKVIPRCCCSPSGASSPIGGPRSAR